ncbi:MAG TPA: hypothetical protein VFJ22_02570, partial [Dermatophilaceae bacterium]|nr:hypothetical protein [Dermatophilaceae bacterium]
MPAAVPIQRSFASPSWIRTLTALGGSVLLCAGVLSGCLGIVGALAQEVGRPGPTSPPEALTLTAAALSTALLAWLCLSLAFALLACLPGSAGNAARRVLERLTPAAVRRWAAFLLGVGLGGAVMPGSAVAGPSFGPDVARSPSTSVVAVPEPGWPPATTLGPDWSASSVAPVAPTTRGALGAPAAPASTQRHPARSGGSGGPPPDGPGWTPSRPSTRPIHTPDLLTPNRGTATTVDEDAVVVVHRGDTLWDIAARHLGRDATDSAIAAEWPRWYEANRELIGGDPDLILPGQRLR